MRPSAAAAALVLLFLPCHAAAQLAPDQAAEARDLYQAGLELMAGEKCDEAAGKFKAAAAIDPLMAMAHYNLGQCRMQTRRYAEAAAAFEDCKAAFERLAWVSQKEREQRDRQRRDEITELKDDLVRMRTMTSAGDTHAPVTALGTRMEERLRQLESMENRDLAGAGLVPAGVYVALGSAYFRQGRLGEAERAYGEAVRRDPKLGAAHNNLAVIYLMTGRGDEAEASMKLAEKNGFRVSPAFKEDVRAATRKSQQ